MICSDVQTYIDNNKLLDSSSKIILGVSGGADSVALLDILYHLGYTCIIAHCNFHLRDEESNRDARYVESLCKNYPRVALEYIDFDTVAYAQQNSISIEMAARELRYAWFEELRVLHHAQCIAVAHHFDDSVETVLLNLIRGTGIRGLTGISPRNGYIIRPLLEITKQQILDYLAHKDINYVDDSTNSEDIYTRNKIRLNILPLMESINPSVKASIGKTAKHLTQVENIYLKYISACKKEVLNNEQIDIARLLLCDEAQAILFEILSQYGFNSSVVENIFHSLEGESGKLFYSDTHQILKDREYLIIRKIEAKQTFTNYLIANDCICLTEPIKLKLEKIDNISNLKFEKDNSILYLDQSKIKYPLTLRKWKQGDWFVPLGMKGKKKVSDYFSDKKFSLFEKENTWLLYSADNSLLWIVGHRCDERFKLTSETNTILKVTYS